MTNSIIGVLRTAKQFQIKIGHNGQTEGPQDLLSSCSVITKFMHSSISLVTAKTKKMYIKSMPTKAIPINGKTKWRVDVKDIWRPLARAIKGDRRTKKNSKVKRIYRNIRSAKKTSRFLFKVADIKTERGTGTKLILIGKLRDTKINLWKSYFKCCPWEVENIR